MASATSSNNKDTDDAQSGNEENQLNISLESDHLDADQKAAHEADTFPMDGPQVAQPNQPNKLSAFAGRCGQPVQTRWEARGDDHDPNRGY